jgi:ribosomal protein S18 acetylase RimI-like enzyme
MIILRKQYKEIPYNKENIEKYKSKNNLLKHARSDKNTEGIMLIDKNTNDLIGYIAWEDNYIIALEVLSDYRGSGYGDILLEKAIKSGCSKLSVSKKNTVAINLYKKYGFKRTKDINDKVIEMELKS